jgi:hypothetical protein
MGTEDEEEIEEDDDDAEEAEKLKGYKDDSIEFGRENRTIIFGHLKDLSKKLDNVRKYLLISGMIGLIVGQTNLVPKKIESLGISFDLGEQASFRYLIIAVIVYFSVQFAQLMANRWNLSLRYGTFVTGPEMPKGLVGPVASAKYRVSLYKWIWLHLLNLFMEAIIPYLVGIVGILALLHVLPKWLSLG